MKTKDLTTSQLRRRTMALAAAGLTSSQQEELRKRALSPMLVAMRENYYKEVVAEPEFIPFSRVAFLKTIPGRQIDLRPKINALGLKIRDQRPRPTCVIFAMCFLLEYGTAVRTDRKGIDLSEEYLNYLDNLTSGKDKDGGFYVDVNAGYQIFGRIAESQLPYQKEYTPKTETKAAKLLPIGRKAPKLPMEVIKQHDPTRGLSAWELDLVCSYLDMSIPVAISCTWPAKNMTKTEVHDGITMMACV